MFGSGHNTLQLNVDSTAPCSACGHVGPRNVLVDYDYHHIFWLFKGVKNTTVRAACTACGDVVALDKRAQRILYAVIGRNPIPFMDRYGGHVLIAIIVAYVAFALAFPCVINPTSTLCLR